MMNQRMNTANAAQTQDVDAGLFGRVLQAIATPVWMFERQDEAVIWQAD